MIHWQLDYRKAVASSPKVSSDILFSLLVPAVCRMHIELNDREIEREREKMFLSRKPILWHYLFLCVIKFANENEKPSNMEFIPITTYIFTGIQRQKWINANVSYIGGDVCSMEFVFYAHCCIHRFYFNRYTSQIVKGKIKSRKKSNKTLSWIRQVAGPQDIHTWPWYATLDIAKAWRD